MKKIKLFSLCILALSFVLAGCKSEPVNPPVTAEDGWYIVGEATSFADNLAVVNLFESTTNENGDANNDGQADNPARPGLYSKYVYLTGGKTFSLTEVKGGKSTTYGSADAKTFNPKGKSDQVNSNILWGTLTADKTLTVPATGMYQVVFDAKLKKIAVIEITHWGIIGGATPGGWGSNTVMNLVGSLSPETNTYKATDVILIADEFKFRYSDGWKVQLSDTITTAAMPVGGENVKVNTNYGGALDALVAGGANIKNATSGVYTVEMTWTKTTGKWTAKLTKTGNYTPPTYPDKMYLVGDGTAYGWGEPGLNAAAEMHKLAGGGDNPGLFWKILFIEGGKGFKVSAAKWGSPNLGFAEATFDTNGVAVTDNGGNMSIATSGMYIVVLDLRNSGKKVSVAPAKVYGMGDPFGGWTKDVAANLFTTDLVAKTMTSPATTAAGNLRMYASHPWIPDWWHAEFNVFGTAIEYRNDGGDQAAVAVTAGKKATLHFDDNTGSIK